MSDFGDPSSYRPSAPPPPPPPTPGSSGPPPPPAYGGPPPAYGGPTAPSGAPPAWGVAPAAARPRPVVMVQAIVLLVGGALVAIGSFVTWFTIAGISFTGFSSSGSDDVRDGPFFLTFGLILVVLAVLLLALRKVLGIAIGAIVVAALTVIFALADLGDVSDAHDRANAFGLDFSVGAGLYLCVIGGLVALGGAIAATAKRRR